MIDYDIVTVPLSLTCIQIEISFITATYYNNNIIISIEISFHYHAFLCGKHKISACTTKTRHQHINYHKLTL